jgi:hypothetical protein
VRSWLKIFSEWYGNNAPLAQLEYFANKGGFWPPAGNTREFTSQEDENENKKTIEFS